MQKCTGEPGQEQMARLGKWKKAGIFGAGASPKCQHLGDAEFRMGRLKSPTIPGLLHKHRLLQTAQKRGQKLGNK